MKSLVYIEPSEEILDDTTKQILLKLRNIPATDRGALIGISIGDQLKGKESLLNGMVDEVIIVEVPSRSKSNTEVITKILADIIRENRPAVFFLSFTFQGMEIGPAVGWCLEVPVITNCIGFEWSDGKANVTRPICGGKLIVSLTVNLDRGAVISVPKGAWKVDEGPIRDEHPVLVTHLTWRDSWAAEKTEMTGIYEETLEDEEDITKAETLVSVGRGLGDAENLPMIKELAEKLEGMVSCSRTVVDLGWLPASRQVGISGKTVAPAIYLALGISGQGNHIAGMDGSRVIIAVNKDPLAPIFSVAHYGIVDDALLLVPELLEQIKERKTS